MHEPRPRKTHPPKHFALQQGPSAGNMLIHMGLCNRLGLPFKKKKKAIRGSHGGLSQACAAQPVLRQTEIPGTGRRRGKQAEASGLVFDIQVVTPSSPEA